MQGTLHEIDIRGILQLIELGQRTGELYIEADPNLSDPETRTRSWYLFFTNGQIVYAVERSNEPLARLQDYLYSDKIELGEDNEEQDSAVTGTRLEYTRLWRLLTENAISPARARAILAAMIRETLFDLFRVRRGSFFFEGGMAIAPALIAAPLAPLLPEIACQVQQWQTYYPQIQQAEQYIALARTNELQSVLPEKAYRNLERWARRKTTLRKLSRYLRRDMATIARNLYPYAERGWLDLVGPAIGGGVGDGTVEGIPREPRLVSIVREGTPVKKVVQWLEAIGYPCTEFTGSSEALSPLFEIEPDAIFCEIALPKLNGYELCHLLRRSTLFRSTPIILLGGTEERIDRPKARIVGATGYLDEPFGEEEFLSLIAKHLPVHFWRNSP